MDDKPYYLIGDVDIHNMDEYKIYMQNTKPIVEKYGGEMIFTPGDIVYSSTKLLNLAEPKIDNYKILDLKKNNFIFFRPSR